jgi:hypothetical protein
VPSVYFSWIATRPTAVNTSLLCLAQMPLVWLQRLSVGIGDNSVRRQHRKDAIALGSGRGNGIKHRTAKIGRVSSVRAPSQKQCHQTDVPSLHSAMQGSVSNVGPSIRIRAVAKEHLRDAAVAQHGDVDQRGITKFIDGVDVGATLGEKPDAVGESFDGQEMKRRFAVKPASVDQIRMRGQQFSRSRVISDRRVDEFADQPGR